MSTTVLLPGEDFFAVVGNGDERDSRSVVIPVIRSAAGWAVTLEITLAPMSLGEGPAWEFYYSFVIVWPDEDRPAFVTQDRNIVARYVPRVFRQRILDLVCRSCRALIDDCRPELIYRVTKGRNLPGNALRKHHLITNVMERAGYSVVESGLDRMGRTLWIMRR